MRENKKISGKSVEICLVYKTCNSIKKIETFNKKIEARKENKKNEFKKCGNIFGS